MAQLIEVPIYLFPDYDPTSAQYFDDRFESENKAYLKLMTTIILENMGKYITINRGDVVTPSHGISKISISNDYLCYSGFKYTYIFNGYELELFSYDMDDYGRIPWNYQFPEFPFDYWTNVLDVGSSLIWFDYRPYRKQMINNLTFEIPDGLEIIDGAWSNPIFTFIKLGLDSKIFFIMDLWEFNYSPSKYKFKGKSKENQIKLMTKLINQKSAISKYETRQSPVHYLYFERPFDDEYQFNTKDVLIMKYWA
jgi:hypothetical protein